VLVFLGSGVIIMTLRALALYYGFSGPVPISFKGLAWLWLPLSSGLVVIGFWLIGGRRSATWTAAVVLPISITISINLIARPGFYYVDQVGQPVFELHDSGQ
jgi:hypothetical protein